MNIRLNGKRVSGVAGQPVSAGQQCTTIETIGDILRAGENGSGRTEIIYTADISYPEIQKYLDYLINEGFINKVNLDDTKVVYQVTESGLRLLGAIDTLLEMIEFNVDSERQP
jgi:predicted transcriptional regulator